MNAIEFLKKEFPISVTLADKHYVAGSNDIAFLMEKYMEFKATDETPLTDKQIEETIWEEMPIPLCKEDIDNRSDGYVLYLNAVHWAKWGRDNHNGI